MIFYTMEYFLSVESDELYANLINQYVNIIAVLLGTNDYDIWKEGIGAQTEQDFHSFMLDSFTDLVNLHHFF